MAQRGAPRTSSTRVDMTFADWRVGFKVALGVMGAGAAMLVLSPFLGPVGYELFITPLIELLGAPDDREFLPRGDSGSGAELLVLLAACNLVAGVSMFCALLMVELLGLGGTPVLTRRMRPRGKAALGLAATGAAVFVPATALRVLLSAVFVDHESEIAWALDTVVGSWRAGGLLLVCSLIPLALSGNLRRGLLLRWTGSVGWGKAGHGWINDLAVALVLGSLFHAVFWFLPFSGAAALFLLVGAAILVAGIVPHARASVGP